ncbi:hypothetical protein [Variovorax boronicumulans]|uniref:hypothetical protein n=1 Tax=Variovorax boronicumulans TaxID=436515 RepID=UPI0024760DA2|nr:hypothetical protein [Variovorax boronicumulans]
MLRVVRDDDGAERQRVGRDHLVEIADGRAARFPLCTQIAMSQRCVHVLRQDRPNAQEVLNDPMQPHSRTAALGRLRSPHLCRACTASFLPAFERDAIARSVRARSEVWRNDTQLLPHLMNARQCAGARVDRMTAPVGSVIGESNIPPPFITRKKQAIAGK